MSHKKHNYQRSLFFSGLFTLLIALFLTCKLALYPFGDHYFRYLDGDQYYGFYGYLLNTFCSKSNLLYSWGISLGEGMLSTYAYYASSPFNLLLFFFRNNLILGMQVITLLKVLFISIAFCLLLNSFDSEHAIEKAVFSTAYAFIGYVVFYAWNLSWMDGVALLPLMLLGLKKLVYERKKALYILVIALAVFSNFYIGYMVCLASGLSYFAYCLYIDSSDSFSLKRLIRTFPAYLLSSLWGVAISLGLFLPSYLALPQNRKENFGEMLSNLKLNFSFTDFASTFYTASVLPKDSPDNLPVTFIGIIPFILLISYFLNRKIRLREKFLSILLIAVFVCSFEIKFINVIWHGFSLNHWFNYRYSFIFSFLLLLIAYRALVSLPQDWKALIFSEVLFLLLTYVVFCVDRPNRINFDLKIFYCDIVLSLAGVLVLCFYGSQKIVPKRAAILGICLLILINTASNAFLLLHSSTQNTSAEEFFSQLHTIEAVKQNIPDQEIARIGNNNAWGRCEACQFDYAGIAIYASTVDVEKSNKLRRFGLVNRAWRFGYTAQVPRSTDDLLGYQYLLSNHEIFGKDFLSLGKQGNEYVYKNDDALPLLFPVNALIDEGDDLNDFEFQNTLFDSFLPEGTVQEKIFEPVEYEMEKDKASHNITITVQDTGEGMIYIQLPAREMNVSVHDSAGERKINYTTDQEIYRIGTPDPDGKLTIELSAEHKIKSRDIYLFKQREEIVSDYIQKIKERQNGQPKEASSSHLQMEVNNPSETLYSSSIPYDSAWEVSVDGEKIQTQMNAGYFLAFSVPEGSHSVDLIYHPKGFRTGMIISIIALLLLIISEILFPGLRRRPEGNRSSKKRNTSDRHRKSRRKKQTI